MGDKAENMGGREMANGWLVCWGIVLLKGFYILMMSPPGEAVLIC